MKFIKLAVFVISLSFYTKSLYALVFWPEHSIDEDGAIQVADLNEDGVDDIVALEFSSLDIYLSDGSGGFSKDHILLLADSANLDQPFLLVDVTGDTHLDAIVLRAHDEFFQVLIGDGTGNLNPTGARYSAGGDDGASMVAADFNNDNNIDIAISHRIWFSAVISIHYGNGNGTFQAPVSFASGSRTGTLVATHVNNDNYPDLIAQNHGDTSIFLGSASGTFTLASTLPVSSAQVYAEDLDGDGNTDIAIHNGGGLLRVYKGNGAGNFSQLGGDSPLIGDADHSVLTDFDSDNQPDFVLVDEDGTTVHFIKGNGDGTFNTAISFPVFDDPSDDNRLYPHGSNFAIGKINSDDRVDIILSTRSRDADSIQIKTNYPDVDNDRWPAFIELAHGTDPNLPDTDNDGLIDSVDPFPTIHRSVQVPTVGFWGMLALSGLIGFIGIQTARRHAVKAPR